MLLARAKYRGKIARTVGIGINLAETKIIDFSYLPPLSFIDGFFSASAISDNGLFTSVGGRTYHSRINAAGNALEATDGNLFGDNTVGVTPMIPILGPVAGNLLAVTFAFNNTSGRISSGVVIYSFEVTLPDEFS